MASREDYRPPQADAAATAVRGPAGSGRDDFSMAYQCGDCGSRVILGKDSVIACDHCMGRVLYKERTKR